MIFLDTLTRIPGTSPLAKTPGKRFQKIQREGCNSAVSSFFLSKEEKNPPIKKTHLKTISTYMNWVLSGHQALFKAHRVYWHFPSSQQPQEAVADINSILWMRYLGAKRCNDLGKVTHPHSTQWAWIWIQAIGRPSHIPSDQIPTPGGDRNTTAVLGSCQAISKHSFTGILRIHALKQIHWVKVHVRLKFQ